MHIEMTLFVCLRLLLPSLLCKTLVPGWSELLPDKTSVSEVRAHEWEIVTGQVLCPLEDRLSYSEVRVLDGNLETRRRPQPRGWLSELIILTRVRGRGCSDSQQLWDVGVPADFREEC